MTVKKLIPALAIMGAVAFTLPACKSKVPDADVKAKVEAVAIPGVTVEVKDGVVTLSGTVSSEADKEAVAANINQLDKEAGVKSVVNNIQVVAPPPPASMAVSTIDPAVQQKVKDGLKDIKGVTGVTFEDNKAVVSGAVTDADRLKIKQSLDAAKVAADFSKLTKK